jgi:glycosyltransferase involved in cell wall biosynthesis
MVSILTLTYQRHHLLEEAIHSYLLQLNGHEEDSEMVIINDSVEVEYIFNHPNVRIINHPTRFSSVGKKLEWGFKQCKGDWIYRLDDDDLLSPWALDVNKNYRMENPTKDIVRDESHYFFSQNEYQGLSSSINCGNCYSKEYIKSVGSIIDKSIGEDNWLTFMNKADIHIGNTGKYTMIYRWGMNTYHISGMGDKPNEDIYRITDKSNKESGVIHLNPKFNEDYWLRIPGYVG